MTALKDTDLCHGYKSYVLLAEFIENAAVSTTKDQNRLVSVVLMSNAAQCLSVDQITLAQHYTQSS